MHKIHVEQHRLMVFIASLFPGSFQALIQYADMMSAQSAKLVSIHLTSPPSLAVSEPHLFSLFPLSAISASIVVLFFFLFFFLLPLSHSLLFQFLYSIQSHTEPYRGDAAYPPRSPAGQIEIFRGVSRGGKIFPDPPFPSAPFSPSSSSTARPLPS